MTLLSQPGGELPNRVMGPFYLGNGLFYISVLATTYLMEHKLAREKQARP